MATASGEDAADGGGGDRCVSVYQREREARSSFQEKERCSVLSLGEKRNVGAFSKNKFAQQGQMRGAKV
jgi:hypothetical protein